MKQLADALGATEVLAKATSAMRSASNGSELVDRIEDETDVEVEVISGLEEARLDLRGRPRERRHRPVARARASTSAAAASS